MYCKLVLGLLVMNISLVLGLYCTDGYRVASYPSYNKISNTTCDNFCAHVSAYAAYEIFFITLGGSDIDFYSCWDKEKCENMTCEKLVQEKREEFLSIIDLDSFTLSGCQIRCCTEDNCIEK